MGDEFLDYDLEGDFIETPEEPDNDLTLAFEDEDELNNDLDLDVLESPVPEVYSEPLEYPCMVLDGVNTVAEVIFLRKVVEDSDVSLPLYCIVDGVYQKIGLAELTVQYLQVLKYVGDYVVSIHKSEESVVELDLNSPNTYYNFMVL